MPKPFPPVPTNYHNWRKHVFIRDGYLCRKCVNPEGPIHAHHVASFISNKELRFEISNGITLCEKCHKAEHTMNKCQG